MSHPPDPKTTHLSFHLLKQFLCAYISRCLPKLFFTSERSTISLVCRLNQDRRLHSYILCSNYWPNFECNSFRFRTKKFKKQIPAGFLLISGRLWHVEDAKYTCEYRLFLLFPLPLGHDSAVQHKNNITQKIFRKKKNKNKKTLSSL